MKKLNLLLLGVLFCAFALNSNAQSDTRAFETFWNIPVPCNGGDLISGPAHGHVVDHFNPVTGVFEWYKFNLFSDELVSTKTGEVFSVNLSEKGKTDGDYTIWPPTGDLYQIIRFNLRGNEGSHIIVTKSWTYDFSSNKWTFALIKAKCF